MPEQAAEDFNIPDEPLTAERAADMAAASLEMAADARHVPEEAAALVQVADGWTRLHTALANAPKTIEPAPVTIKCDPATVKDSDIAKLGEQFRREWARLHEVWYPEPAEQPKPALTLPYDERQQPTVTVYGSLTFSDATPIMTCQCGVRCFGDSINDALAAWGTHLTTLHRNDL